jgi:hypothetical protein
MHHQPSQTQRQIVHQVEVGVILFLAIIIAMLSVYLVFSAFQPLTEGEVMTAEEWERLEDETLNLLERRDRVFEEIRELEFESALNKVEPTEFARLRRRYEDQAIDIMNRLQVEFDTYGSRIEQDVLSLVEAAKRRREEAKAPVAQDTPVPALLETEPLAAMPASDASTTVNETVACVQCEASIPSGSRFCDCCGSTQHINCSVCSEGNRLDARFCKGCGSSFQVTEVTA